MPPPLADHAFSTLNDYFKAEGSSLKGNYGDAILAFLRTLEAGLNGTLDPKYHLLSLDPGMGKTTAIIHFLNTWREAGFEPASSILIGVSTLDEIRSMVLASGLEPSDFAVLTSEPEDERPGLREASHGLAKVLFTTQSMIRSRSKGRTFAETSAFHFAGRPRPLRIWDESILPSRGVVLRLDDLEALKSPIRPVRPDLIDALTDLIDAVRKAPADQSFTVPDAASFNTGDAVAIRRNIDGNRLKATFDDMQVMAGSPMLTVADDRYGKVLIGTTPSLPDDFAPVVVVDASIRVQGTYPLWSRERGGIERLPSAGNVFHDLNVFHWQQSAGRDALEDPARRRVIAQGIVDKFSRDPEGEWLIVSRQGTLADLIADIERLSPADVRPSLHQLHWGKHRSTNAFRNVDNIVIVGLHRYRDVDYLAHTMAASGRSAGAVAAQDIANIKTGEIRHHLLQAACRGSVRNASSGVAGRCNLFLVDALGDAEAFLDVTFPGCNFIEWEGAPDASPMVQRVIDFLHQTLIVEGQLEVRKAEIAQALGQTGQNLSTNAYSKPALEKFLADHSLEKAHKTFRHCIRMSPSAT